MARRPTINPLTLVATAFGRGLLVLVPTVGTIYTVWLVLHYIDSALGVPIPGLGITSRSFALTRVGNFESTLILRSPAAVHVATPALPASARLLGSAPRVLRWASSVGALPQAPHSALATLALTSSTANAVPTARVPPGCPSGQRGLTPAIPPQARSPIQPVFRVSIRELRAPPLVAASPTSLRSPTSAFGSG